MLPLQIFELKTYHVTSPDQPTSLLGRFYFIAQFLIGALFFLALGTSSNAHEVRPTIVEFASQDDGSFTLSMSVNLEALIAGIGAEHDDTDQSENAGRYNALRALTMEKLAPEFAAFSNSLLQKEIILFGDQAAPLKLETVFIPPPGDLSLARLSTVLLVGQIPDGAETFRWSWPEAYGQSVIRVDETADKTDPSKAYSAFLRAGEVSEEIPIKGGARGFFQVFAEYLKIGFDHIIPKGLDHILFVVGLFLLSTRLPTLLWQITSFTLAHTVTLALGALGVISISPAIVEPLIAASIVYVCVENILTDKLHRWRPVLIFCFGLLHGLGFAGILSDIGLAQGQFFTSLIAFNIGVEIGQLAVIAICFLVVGFWFQSKQWYRHMISIPASVVIALIGIYWVVERTLLA